MSNVETWPQISTGEKVHFYFPPLVHFSLPFPIYFTLETKIELVIARAEKGIEDNFQNKYSILIK